LEILFEQNDAGDHGQKWMVGLRSAILSLADNARLYPTVVQRHKPRIETRPMPYGKKPHTYRVFYEIRDDTVAVIHILGPGQIPKFIQ
jgi:hypothetical protein